MNAKLTLRLDQGLIERAKEYAARQGRSVSQIVGDYFRSMSPSQSSHHKSLGPITRELCGTLKRKGASRREYREHLEKKYR